MASKRPPVKRLIIQKARKYGLDPAAVLAVAMGEGGLRWGAVGDNGTSFGPFQLHVGGALPKGKDARWANSPAGLDYAIRTMSKTAKGLKGEAAVNAIIRDFERPADPDTSVSRAVARLGSLKAVGGRVATSPLAMPAGLPPQAPSRSLTGVPAQAMGTLNDIFAKVGLAPLDIVGDLPLPQPAALSVPGAPPAPIVPGAPAQPPPLKPGKLPKLPKLNLMMTAIQKAQAMGLSVRENSFVDPVDPVHTKGSDHYKTIGTRKGRKVSGAIDVSGDPKKMRAFFEWAEQYAGRGLNDLFFDPVGYSYDRGNRWDKTIGGHGDHVHFSV